MFGRNEDTFVGYSNKIRGLLEKGDYDSALARYNRLKDFYDLLSDEEKIKFESEFNSLVKQLMIYLKIDELKVVIKGDSLGLMKDYLEEIDYLNNTTFTMSSRYREFVNREYSKYLNEFNYRVVLEELNEWLEAVYKLRDEGNFDIALNMFPRVMNKFNELSSYGIETSEIYPQLIGLREELKVKLLKMRAYSDYAKTNIKTLKKALRGKDFEKARILHERVFS